MTTAIPCKLHAQPHNTSRDGLVTHLSCTQSVERCNNFGNSSSSLLKLPLAAMTTQIVVACSVYTWHRSWGQEAVQHIFFWHSGPGSVGRISFSGSEGHICNAHGAWLLLAPEILWLKFDAQARLEKMVNNLGFMMRQSSADPGKWQTIWEQTQTETFMKWKTRICFTIGQNLMAISSAAATPAQGGRAPMYSTPEMGGRAPMDMDPDMDMDMDPDMDQCYQDIIAMQGGRAPMDMDATVAS